MRIQFQQTAFIEYRYDKLYKNANTINLISHRKFKKIIVVIYCTSGRVDV